MARRGYYKGIKKLLVLYLFCMIVLEGMGLYFPMLLQSIASIAEHHFEDGNAVPILWEGLVVFLFITGLFIMQFVCEWVGAMYMDKYQQNMRTSLFDKFSKVSQEQMDHIGVPKIMPIMLNDTNWLKKFNRYIIIFLVYFPVAVLGSFIMLFSLDIRYALFALASLPIVVLFFWWNSHRIAKIIPDSVTLNDECYIAINEGIKGAKEIRTLGKADERSQDFERFVTANRLQAFKTNRATAFSTAFNAVLFTFVTIAIVIYGAMTATNITDVVILNTSIQYINKIWAGSHQIFIWFVDFIPRCAFTKKRLGRYYALPEVEPATGYESVPMFDTNRIKISNVTYQNINEKKELDDVSMEIQNGTCVAVTGTTDSGKTALKNVLMKIFTPTSGAVTFNDIDIQQINTNSWRRDYVSFCDGSPQFIPGTVRENMQLLSPDVTDEQILAAFREVGAEEFVQSFQGILDYEMVENNVVGGGMKNILNIVRCILKPAPLYIFNQCFDHLKNDYIEKLIKWLHDNRKTAVFITYKGTVCFNCDVVHVLRDGAIVATGTHTELLKKSKEYRALDIAAGGMIVEELAVLPKPEANA